MESSAVRVGATGLGKTLRRDRWWAPPLTVAVGLAICGAYATWAIFQGRNFFAEPYLSPFYSPCITSACPAEIRFLGIDWWPFSPAILLMWVILGFRATCYYYRKAYYRAYFLDPPACAVEEPHRRYRGETAFPFILQNAHRYFLYASIVIWLFLAWDTVHGFRFEDGFGVGVGSLVLLVNLVLLGGYWFGCHSFRHLIGGKVDCVSCTRFGAARHRAWRGTTWFNRLHMEWAWASLVFVCLADLYVRLVAAGTIPDLRLF